jgi:formyl-CoA transferase
MQILGAAGIPCGACQDAHDLLHDPHLHEREMILEMEYPGRGKNANDRLPGQASGIHA